MDIVLSRIGAEFRGVLCTIVPATAAARGPGVEDYATGRANFSTSSPTNAKENFPSKPANNFPYVPTYTPPSNVTPTTIPTVVKTPVPLFFLLSDVSDKLDRRPARLGCSTDFTSTEFVLFTAYVPSGY